MNKKPSLFTLTKRLLKIATEQKKVFCNINDCKYSW